MRAFFRLVSVLCLGLPLLYSLFGHVAAAATYGEMDSNVGSLPISPPATDGHYVTWFDNDNNLHVLVDQQGILSSQQVYSVKGSPVKDSLKADNGYAVWYDEDNTSTTVNAINLATGQQMLLGEGFYPAISGDLVAYSSGAFIVVRHISVPSQIITISKVTTETNSYTTFVAMDGNQIVWADTYSAGHELDGYNLYSIKVGDTSPTLLKKDIGYPELAEFHNGLLIYAIGPIGPGLLVYNFKTGQEIPLINTAKGDTHPTTDGRYIFWAEGNYTYSQNHVITIRGYDTQTQSYFDVTPNNEVNDYPVLRNGNLYWLHGNYTPDSDTYGFYGLVYGTVGGVLPNAPTAGFDNTANFAFFPQTSHSLSFGFKYFWEHSGGLPVFGYPLSQEFQEPNPNQNVSNDEALYTVQYFERERFEYHPEFKGTPYETELGRLGVTDAQQRGLTSNKAFQPATNSHQAGCTYFQQTQHNVCGDFASYWSSHGLDFGDAGTSFRESLALFGYPISEPFTDPQSGLTVQYFERARFEYHPEFKGTSNVVELGQLGKAALQAKGWQ